MLVANSCQEGCPAQPYVLVGRHSRQKLAAQAEEGRPQAVRAVQAVSDGNRSRLQSHLAEA